MAFGQDAEPPRRRGSYINYARQRHRKIGLRSGGSNLTLWRFGSRTPANSVGAFTWRIASSGNREGRFQRSSIRSIDNPGRTSSSSTSGSFQFSNRSMAERKRAFRGNRDKAGANTWGCTHPRTLQGFANPDPSLRASIGLALTKALTLFVIFSGEMEG